MDWLYSGGKLLGIEWHFWKVIGWLGNAAFFSRFMVQWYATEKRKEVVVPIAFWWLSLLGSFLLLSYAVFYQRDSVFIFAYAFTWFPYVRNILIQKRTAARQLSCPTCQSSNPAAACFCMRCGAKLAP